MCSPRAGRAEHQVAGRRPERPRDHHRRRTALASAEPAAGAGLRADLRPPRVSAHRQLPGPGPADDRGDHATGCWPAIISPEDSDRLRALLYKGPGQPQMRSARYLLSSVFRCGLCGSKLVGRAIAGKPRYQCVKDCVTTITVNPASPARRWDPDRIHPNWIV
jgi:hypothetical protein